MTLEQIDINLLKNKDEGEYKKLVEAYNRPLLNVVSRIINSESEAEEIVQEVFISFYNNAQKFEGRSKIFTWLYRVATNRAIDLIRKREREKKYRVKEYVNVVENDSFSENTLDTIILSEALNKLDDTFRIPLLLSEYEGQSYQDIANALSLPVNTVRTRIFRARKKLLEILKKMGVSL